MSGRKGGVYGVRDVQVGCYTLRHGTDPYGTSMGGVEESVDVAHALDTLQDAMPCDRDTFIRLASDGYWPYASASEARTVWWRYAIGMEMILEHLNREGE